ncbi:MAG: PorT family protein [Bacteroidales bacterium]|nr:PorT family protein [Bacteroidales bacterium]MCB9013188.1 PorT family protein [Bacteroidales bacterium]
MQKRLILLLIAFMPLIAVAQSLRFSLKADPQFSWMVPDTKEIKAKGAVLGINAGLDMDYFFAENYAFSTGLSVNNIGGKLSFSDTVSFKTTDGDLSVPSNQDITYKLQYISIPLGLKFKTNEIGYATFFANIGVTPMVNIRDRASDASGVLDKSNIADEIMLFNMNYFLNLGVQYSLGGSTALIGGLGYSSGFVDVTSRSVDKITVNTLSLKIGILF